MINMTDSTIQRSNKPGLMTLLMAIGDFETAVKRLSYCCVELHCGNVLGRNCDPVPRSTSQ